jgi:hypothetical protein
MCRLFCRCRTRGAWLFPAVFLAGLAFGPSGVAVALRDSEQLTIVDPRPVAAAVREFERRCRCVVTYEDVRWRQDQVQDLAGFAGRRSGLPTPQIPKSATFTFDVPRQLELRTPAEIAGALREVLAVFETGGNAGGFRLVEGNGAFHVLPKINGVLDAPVTLGPGKRTLATLIAEMLASLSQTTGQTVLLATGPVNVLQQTSVDIAASNERAGDVLSRALFASGRKLSWQLLYDFGPKRYYLNIYQI